MLGVCSCASICMWLWYTSIGRVGDCDELSLTVYGSRTMGVLSCGGYLVFGDVMYVRQTSPEASMTKCGVLIN